MGNWGLILRHNSGAFHNNWSEAYLVPWFQHLAPGSWTATDLGEEWTKDFYQSTKSENQKEKGKSCFLLFRGGSWSHQWMASGASSRPSLEIVFLTLHLLTWPSSNSTTRELTRKGIRDPTIHQLNHNFQLNRIPRWFICTLSLRSISLSGHVLNCCSPN